MEEASCVPGPLRSASNGQPAGKERLTGGRSAGRAS
jgi:hypothetical protein